jgi:hypothetical protein
MDLRNKKHNLSVSYFCLVSLKLRDIGRQRIPSPCRIEAHIRNRELRGKLAAKHMKMRRVVIVPKNHHVKGANAANRRHAFCLAVLKSVG